MHRRDTPLVGAARIAPGRRRGRRCRAAHPRPAPRGAAGLRLVLTVLSTGLVALVSALLLWLGWLLVGGVVNARSRLPAGQPGAGRRPGRAGRAGQRRRRGRGAGEVLRAGLIAFPLVVLAAALVSWVAGRPGARAAARGHGDGAPALGRVARHPAGAAATPRGEVAELADGFDAMLDRLQAAFDAQRRFVANASHELRTPLAVLRTEVDVTLADPDADVDELRRMGDVVREATRRADELIAGLLLLARSEAPSAVDPAAVRHGRSRRPRRARAGRDARPRPTRRGLRVARAARAGADGGRPGAARAAWPGTSWRTRCGTTSPAGWVEIRTGVRGRVRRAVRELGRARRSRRSGWRSCSSRSGAGRWTARRTRPAPGWGCRSSARWCTRTAARWRPSRCRAAGSPWSCSLPG